MPDTARRGELAADAGLEDSAMAKLGDEALAVYISCIAGSDVVRDMTRGLCS